MHHEDAVSAEPALELRDGGAAAMQQQEFGAIAVEPGARKFFFCGSRWSGGAANPARCRCRTKFFLHVRTTIDVVDAAACGFPL